MKPNILDFDDYSPFLRAYYNYRKLKDSYWSYAFWARKLDVANSSVIHKIVQGKRNLSQETMGKLLLYFNFNSREEWHFKKLVSYKELNSESLAKDFLKEDIRMSLLIRNIEHKNEVFHLEVEKDYTSLIRCFLELFPQYNSAQLIAYHLRSILKAEDVKCSLRNLEEMELVKKTQSGFELIEKKRPLERKFKDSNAWSDFQINLFNIIKNSFLNSVTPNDLPPI